MEVKIMILFYFIIVFFSNRKRSIDFAQNRFKVIVKFDTNQSQILWYSKSTSRPMINS